MTEEQVEELKEFVALAVKNEGKGKRKSITKAPADADDKKGPRGLMY